MNLSFPLPQNFMMLRNLKVTFNAVNVHGIYTAIKLTMPSLIQKIISMQFKFYYLGIKYVFLE